MKDFIYSIRLGTYYLLLLLGPISNGQESVVEHDLSLGIGVGLDYGGIGLKISAVKFNPQFEFTIGIGYNLNLFGVSGGLLVRSSPEKPVTAYLSAMYGYVGVIKIKGYASSTDSKTYFGPSFSTGIEIRGSKRKNYFKIGVILPVRPKSFKEDVIKYNADKPWAVLPSLGYHIVL